MGFFGSVGNFFKKAYRGVKSALNTGVKIGNKVLNNPVVDVIRDVSAYVPGLGGIVNKGLTLAQRAVDTGAKVSRTIEKGEEVVDKIKDVGKSGFHPAVIQDALKSAAGFHNNIRNDFL